ncbi:LysR family transcriptional regulator [Salipiger mangrovisoli]|uniref:LysR family transcriptional regulator n=1 Tax=Salipiger mangrovisoli TaxID=2865933 RepID=A0ABR9X9Y6_9RHOB|nr:LysR substrate-binding domain-containing protein [Salipiger mangrovisoli]MBE9640289.1 LysR family transcriptional regulator [Salipiger mangrovisoli]
MEEFSQRFSSLKPFLVFECAARSGSFSAAAKAFNISQPSVSRNVAQLEREIGVALFERRSTGAELTDAGRELFHAITQGMSTILRTIKQIERRRHEEAGVVSLSVSGSFVAHWMAPRLAAFTQAFPDVRLRFHLISGMVRGLPDDVDLAVRTMDASDQDVRSWDFVPEIVLPVCSPGYAAARKSTGNETFLHFSDHAHDIWNDMSDLCLPGQLEGDVCHEFDDYSVLLQAALDGSGVALGWLSVTSKLLLDRRLVPVGGRAHRTGRVHRLIDCGAGPSRDIVADIAQWLVERMKEDLAALEPILPATT